MKPRPLFRALPFIAAICVSHAGEQQIEIRLLKTTGVSPNEVTLKSVLENPGAQAVPAVTKVLIAGEVAKIGGTTPFRYASEYTSEGAPCAFGTKDLGMKGTVSARAMDAGRVDLKLDLECTTADAPHIYEVEGVQITMPVFNRVSSDLSLTVKPGEWVFLNATSGEKPLYWAVRVIEGK